MSGSIEEVPLPDLLQLFGTSKKSGVLVIRTDDDVGASHLKKGNIAFAIINDLDDVPPLKALYRMLTWQKGLFDLEPPDEREFPTEMNASRPRSADGGDAAARRVQPPARAAARICTRASP